MQIKKQQPDMEQWTGSKLGKEYIKAVYLLFNFYVEYIVLIAGLDESQAGIKLLLLLSHFSHVRLCATP